MADLKPFSLYYLTCCFLFFSVLGWIYEFVLGFWYGFGFINRGFLFGPYLPIYGFGFLVMFLCLHRLMGKKIKILGFTATPFIVFFLIIFITTALEYAASVLLESIFHKRWWDYSTYSYNLNGRICLSASLRFGLGGMVFLYILEPLARKLLSRPPEKMLKIIAVFIILALIADLTLTLYFANVRGFDPELVNPKY